MTAPTKLVALGRVLEDARLWGMELDTRYRVLAATFEPDADRHPKGDVDDRRVQLLCFPVGEIAAQLRRSGDAGIRIETFTVEQLPAVVAKFDGGAPGEVTFDHPQAHEWPGERSFEGRSQAFDGHRHRLDLRLATAEAQLLLTVTFDEIELRDPDGDDLDLPV